MASLFSHQNIFFSFLTVMFSGLDKHTIFTEILTGYLILLAWCQTKLSFVDDYLIKLSFDAIHRSLAYKKRI